MVGIELDETEDGAHILSFAEQVWEEGLEGLPLQLAPGETGAVTIEIQSELDPDGDLQDSEVDLAVVDEVSGGIPSALLGLSQRPRVPGSTLVEYAVLDGDGELAAFADVLHLAPLTGAHARGAPEGEPLVLREPPHVVVEPGGSLDLTNEAVELTGADWAQARFVVLVSEGQIIWVVVPPKGATSIRLPPAPPDAPWPDSVIVVATAMRWTSEPWEQVRLAEPGWARSQLRELAFDASVQGRLRPEPDPELPPDVEDCGGTDDLEVLVVDDVPFFTEGGEPHSEIELVIDCVAGRMRATTDAQGRATFHGLDFANDTPDLSAIDPDWGGPGKSRVRTRVALGADRPVPSPYVFNLYRAWGHAPPPPTTVTIERSADGTELHCWSTGAHPFPRDWPYPDRDQQTFLESDTTFDAAVHEELSPARVGCLEFDGTAAGPRTMVAFGELEVVPGQEPATLVMDGAVPWDRRSSIRVDHRDPAWSAQSVLRAFVEDEGPFSRGLPIGMNETSVIGADGIDTIGLAWASDARQATPWLRLEILEPVFLGVKGWEINVPMGELDQPWVAKAPPRVTAVGEGADRVIQITGAEDWAQDYYVEYSSRYEYYVPAGQPTPAIRIGRLPDDREPAYDAAFVRAFRYDAPLPEQDHLDGEWFSQHVRESAWYPNVSLE
jgi:hypothetical protein